MAQRTAAMAICRSILEGSLLRYTCATASPKPTTATTHCTRLNGTFTQRGIGPSLPEHDLAHYVVERELHG